MRKFGFKLRHAGPLDVGYPQASQEHEHAVEGVELRSMAKELLRTAQALALRIYYRPHLPPTFPLDAQCDQNGSIDNHSAFALKAVRLVKGSVR